MFSSEEKKRFKKINITRKKISWKGKRVERLIQKYLM